MQTPALLLLLLLLLHSICWPPVPKPAAATDFLFNGFNPANFTLYGDAAVETGLRTLSLTNPSAFSVGRALYKTKVKTRDSAAAGLPVLPFHASFIFSMATIPGTLPGHGIAFLFSPTPGTNGATAAQHMGLFNRSTDGDPSNRVLAVEFDVFQNEEFADIDANHVGVDLYSLTSVAASPAGYWPEEVPLSSSSSPFVSLKLNDGSNYQAWVDYEDGRLNVTMAPTLPGKKKNTKKPTRPLVTVKLDLSSVFHDEMYVGFCAATGKLVERHRILGWSFSNYNTSLSQALDTGHLPSFEPNPKRGNLPKGAVAGILAAAATVSVIAAASSVFWWQRRRKKRGETGQRGVGSEEEAMEDWESEYWPHRIAYRDISTSTGAFSVKNLIGSGGNGKVYRGVLGGAPVAVKLFARNTAEEARQFVAEVSSLGRLRHRNLVGLRGWCRKEGGDLILVYDYMENGSLDKKLFESEEPPLDWKTRVRILKDVAAALTYLHDGWESRVLHRDVKASNVMLDGAMSGRLGDFGLARVHPHQEHDGLGTSRVVGSVGYLAPEVVRSGRATAATDVYGFGVLVLEAVTGRRTVAEGRPPLVECVRTLGEAGEALSAVDPRLQGAVDEGEALRLLQLGLTCTCEDQASRPTMRQAAVALEGPGETKEGDGEAAEMWLLDRKLRGAQAVAPTATLWTWTRKQQGRRSGSDGPAAQYHLTFEELRLAMSCSASLSVSDFVVEGR